MRKLDVHIISFNIGRWPEYLFSTPDRRERRLALHALMWVAMFFFYVYLKGPVLALPGLGAAPIALKDLVVIMAIFYTLFSFIVPRFLNKRAYFLGALSLVGLYYFYALSVYVEFLIFPNIMDIPGRGYQGYASRVVPEGVLGVFIFKNFAEIFLDLTYLAAPAILIKLIIELIKSNNRTLTLERDNLDLELAFLKAQINPHFLFNSLNNIYSLILYKQESAADTVLKLSDLLRYTLYDSNSQQISLENEVIFFKNFVDLERIRHSARVSVDFQINGDFKGLSIAPLIIFPFIENAFKHGVNSSMDKSWVAITIEAKDATLHVHIKNSLHAGKKKVAGEIGGIGASNAVKRLNLLYKDKHTIDISQADRVYSVDLSITLK